MSATVITMVGCSACLMVWALWDLRVHADIKHRRTAAAMCAAAWLLMLAAVHHQMDETQRLIAVRAAKPIATESHVLALRECRTKNGHSITWESFQNAGSYRPVFRTADGAGGSVVATGRANPAHSGAW